MTHVALQLKPARMESLKQLAKASGACVSLYLPAYQQGAGVGRTDVVLRSLVNVAEEKLKARDVASVDIEDLLEPVRAQSFEDWMQRGHSQGIAIFRSPTVLEGYWLPQNVQESVHVSASFHIIPALEQMASPPEFWVVALTRKGVRLLHGTPDGLEQAKLPDSVAPTLDEFLALEPGDHRRAGRSAAGPSVGSMKGVAFGTGVEMEVSNRHFRDYCVAIDRGLRAMLEPDHPPLIVEGATFEVSTYRGASQYANIAGAIVRSPDDGGLADSDLNMKVRAMLAETPSPAEVRAHDYVSGVLGSHLAVTELTALVRMASRGRADVTFLCAGCAQHADVDHITGRIRLAGEFVAEDDDLFNAAAVETLKHSGEVYVVPAERIPGGSGAVSRLRY